jgi:hypothetical protein
MAVAAPKRRSSAAAAPAPSRTKPPKRKAAPGKPRKVDFTKGGAAAPAKAPTKAPARKPARRKPARKGKAAAAPARKPVRRAPGPGRRVAAGGQLIPLAVGRSATALRGLPDSGLVVRMTRGRAWIGVLGVLLVGIVALNVVTLSFAASSGKIDEKNTALEKENTTLKSREGRVFSQPLMRHEAAAMGLAMPTTEQPLVINPGPQVAQEAAARLAQMSTVE